MIHLNKRRVSNFTINILIEIDSGTQFLYNYFKCELSPHKTLSHISTDAKL